MSLGDVVMWDTLKAEIECVLEQRPGALVSYPDPRSDRGREPSLRIGLAPWATDVARDLNGRFGGSHSAAAEARLRPLSSRR